jgi:acetylornithine deacetylase/succinyl-diaminopimelate desuccinylase-like protein
MPRRCRWLALAAALLPIWQVQPELLASPPENVPGLDYAKAGAEGLEHLQALVRLDTSNPPGNESRVTAYLAEQLKKAGLEPKLFESVPGRGSLMVRYRGTGAGKPLLIMSHIDVVPVERDRWSVPPFDGLVQDGFLWGRGTLDDKGMAAAELETMLLLARHKPKLARDVIFLAEADEEAGGTYGMDYLLEKHPELFDAELVLNEGGLVVWDQQAKIQYVAVQTTEKVYQDFTILAHGTAGHSSIPAGDNPVVRLIQALDRLGKITFPVSLNDTTRGFFKGLSSVLRGGACAVKLEDPTVGARCAALLSTPPALQPFSRRVTRKTSFPPPPAPI